MPHTYSPPAIYFCHGLLSELRAELQAIEYFDIDFLTHDSSEDACLSFLLRRLHRDEVLRKIEDLVAGN